MFVSDSLPPVTWVVLSSCKKPGPCMSSAIDNQSLLKGPGKRHLLSAETFLLLGLGFLISWAVGSYCAPACCTAGHELLRPAFRGFSAVPRGGLAGDHGPHPSSSGRSIFDQ